MSTMGDGIGPLLDQVIDGRCDDAQLRRFEAMISSDPGVREAYLYSDADARNACMVSWAGRVPC